MESARPHDPTISDIIRRYYTVWGMYSFAGGFLFGAADESLISKDGVTFDIHNWLEGHGYREVRDRAVAPAPEPR